MSGALRLPLHDSRALWIEPVELGRSGCCVAMGVDSGLIARSRVDARKCREEPGVRAGVFPRRQRVAPLDTVGIELEQGMGGRVVRGPWG